MNILAQTYIPMSNINGTEVSADKYKQIKNYEEAKAAAQDFEAFFLSRMSESMFEGVSTEGIFGGGHAEKIYRSMLLNEYGKIMAKSGTVGVAYFVMDSILQLQAAQPQQGDAYIGNDSERNRKQITRSL